VKSLLSSVVCAFAFLGAAILVAAQNRETSTAGMVIQPEEGESLDLCGIPELSVNIKIDPASIGSPFSMGTGKVTGFPGDPAAHEEFDEVIFIHSGSGSVTVGTETFPASPGMTLYIPRGTDHRFVSSEETPLEFVWILSPPGYEESLRQANSESASKCDSASRGEQ